MAWWPYTYHSSSKWFPHMALDPTSLKNTKEPLTAWMQPLISYWLQQGAMSLLKSFWTFQKYEKSENHFFEACIQYEKRRIFHFWKGRKDLSRTSPLAGSSDITVYHSRFSLALRHPAYRKSNLHTGGLKIRNIVVINFHYDNNHVIRCCVADID